MNRDLKKVLLISILIIIVLAVCIVVLLNQRTDASYTDHIAEVSKMYQTSTYENDPNYGGLVSGIRTGVKRDLESLNYGEYECTDDGAYFSTSCFGCYLIPTNGTIGSITGNYLFYLDHNSDTVIKLCGRPDCTHDNDACNSFVRDSMDITYYDGHLYYVDVILVGSELAKLYRMDLNGSNRTEVLTVYNFKDKVYTTCMTPKFINGVFMVGMMYIDAETGAANIDWYYCKLDENVVKLKSTATAYCWTDGEAFLHGAYTNDENGNPLEWRLMQWDPDTDTEWVVNTISDVEDVNAIVKNTYWGEKCGLCHRDGKIYKINYPNTEMEVLFETGVSGNQADFYPDCIAVWEKSDYQTGKRGTLHFFDYDGNKLGQVLLDIPSDFDGLPTLGETRDRIFVRGTNMLTIPSHYIDKSEFGTGEITLHKLEYPDLKELEQEWLFTAKDLYLDVFHLYDPENYGKIE